MTDSERAALRRIRGIARHQERLVEKLRVFSLLRLPSSAAVHLGDSVRWVSPRNNERYFARINAIVQVSSQDDAKAREFFCVASPYVPVDGRLFLESETELRNVVLRDAEDQQIAFPVNCVDCEACIVEDFQQPEQLLVNYYWRSISRFDKHARAAGR